MKVTVVVEKPSITRAIAPHLRRQWPNASIAVIHARPYSNFRQKYPRGLAWKDFPFIGEPQYEVADWPGWAPVEVNIHGDIAACVMTDDLFASSTIVINACDQDHTGAIAFTSLIEAKPRLLANAKILSVRFGNSAEISVQNAFANPENFYKVFAKEIVYGKMRRYFDWNWNVNSLGVFGKTMSMAGAAKESGPLSKYALQTLYFVAKRGQISSGAIIDAMENWKGSGKYSIDVSRPGFGSPGSRSRILQNCIDAGFIETNDSGSENKIAPLGSRLLGLIHPDCEDPDLPFRIDQWCLDGSTSSKEKIDRYIRSFFGKQIRFLNASRRSSLTP